jgi:hypothetical protein
MQHKHQAEEAKHQAIVAQAEEEAASAYVSTDEDAPEEAGSLAGDEALQALREQLTEK